MTSNGDASKDIFNEIRKQDMFMYYQNVFGGGAAGANGSSGDNNHSHPPVPHPPLHHHHHHQHLGPPGAHLLPSSLGVGGASTQEVNQACATAVAQVADSHNADLMLCTNCKLYIVRKRYHLHACDNIIHSQLDPGYNEIIDNRFQPGITKDIILTDPIIIAHGHRRYVQGLKKMARSSDVRKATMTDMRELSRLLQKFRFLFPEKGTQSIKSMLTSCNIDSVFSAMKALSARDGGEKCGLLMNLNALLRRVSKSIVSTHLCQLTVEESDDIDKFIHEYNDRVPTILLNARQNTGRNSQKTTGATNGISNKNMVDKKTIGKDLTRDEYMREMLPYLEHSDNDSFDTNSNDGQPMYPYKFVPSSQSHISFSQEDKASKKSKQKSSQSKEDKKVKKIRNITWTHDDFTELIKLFPSFWESAMLSETGPLPAKQEILNAIQHFSPDCLSDLTDQQQYLKIRIKLFNERKKRFKIVQESLKSN